MGHATALLHERLAKLSLLGFRIGDEAAGDCAASATVSVKGGIKPPPGKPA